MVDFHGLYKSYLQGFKEIGGCQAVALCHNHEDTKPSLSINFDKGLCNCFACGYKANAYQFAKDIGHPNPKEYIVDNGVGVGSVAIHTPEQSSSVTSPPKEANGQVPTPKPNPHPDLEKLMEQYKTNLKNNMDKFPHHTWVGEEFLIDEMDIGLDEHNNLVFGYRDSEGNLIGIKIHKKNTIGDGKNKWYLPHLIAEHQHEKDVFITEGEKCCFCLVSRQIQATTVTTGCMSIPRNEDGYCDIEWLQYYTGWIYICYDNDDAGRKGAEKLANAIIKEYPSHKVAIIQWDKSLPQGWDIFDSYDKHPSGQEFKDAVLNAKVIKPYVPDTLGRFNVIGGVDADKREYKKTFQIIESLMPENAQIIIGGTKGCNKSAMAMQWGGSLACDMPSFLDFKINKKGLSVLYIDTEIGENLALERREMMVQNFGDRWDRDADQRFNMITLDASSEDETGIFQSIEEAIILFKPDVVIIDCLYNIAEGVDISKNHNVSKITTIITRLKFKYSITPIIVAHATKGNYEQGLVSDRIAGGSHLQNWAEHIILLTESGIEDNLRLLRIDKSRSIAYPKCYYGIELDESTFYLSNAGIIENPKAHMISPDKKHKWALALENMQDEFTTIDFRNQVECIMHMSDRTARNWLTDMARCHIIEDVGYGKWEKKLRLISEENE